MRSAGGSQKKRKAVVRKESADTGEYESCQWNNMDMDMNENVEELSSFPIAVRRSAGWHKHKFMCDRQCRVKGFKCCPIAPVMVEGDGEPRTRYMSGDTGTK